MGLLSRFIGTKEKPTKSKDEWIAICLKLDGGSFGSQGERERIHLFTDKLDEVIRASGMGVFDGDEFGNGECGVFMYGPNADRLFDVVEPLLKTWESLKGGYAIKRYGAPSEQSERVQF